MGRGHSRHCFGEHWFLDPWKFEEVWKVAAYDEEGTSVCCTRENQGRAYGFWTAITADGSLDHLCCKDLCQIVIREQPLLSMFSAKKQDGISNYEFCFIRFFILEFLNFKAAVKQQT